MFCELTRAVFLYYFLPLSPYLSVRTIGSDFVCVVFLRDLLSSPDSKNLWMSTYAMRGPKNYYDKSVIKQ